jgi:rubrerythrin
MGIAIDFSRLSPKEVLDIAIQIEEEAQQNYEQLATWMAAEDNDEVEKFFNRMANLERLHRDQIANRRQQMFGDAEPRDSTWVVWDVEQTDYDEIGNNISLEKAFELAMDAERRAGEYYAEALDYATDPKVIELFESLRDSESEHLRMLREQRERVFG